jgi:surface glycoprotein (TIGR04207 family)
MKKLIVLTLTVIMVLSLVAPSIALAGTTSVEIASGDELPIVKCKWEQLPCAPYDDDAYTPGLQVLPPLKAGAMRPILYYAVVTHPRGVDNIQRVDADVYHPDGSPEPYGPSVVGGVIPMPYFKYEIPMEYDSTGDEAEAKVNAAYGMDLITFADGYNLTEVIGELDKGTAELWVGCAPIDYEQPAGDYKVWVFAADLSDLSEPLMNTWNYIPTAGVEVDFDSVDFGATNLGVEKMIPGDIDWDPNDSSAENATVRNVGNTWAAVQVTFSDMGFGDDYYHNWNVQFDARMGSDPYYYEDCIMPEETRTLRNALGLSMKDELDFSIKVLKGTGKHGGTITIGSVIVPFGDDSDIVGFDATCDYEPMPNPCESYECPTDG